MTIISNHLNVYYTGSLEPSFTFRPPGKYVIRGMRFSLDGRITSYFAVSILGCSSKIENSFLPQLMAKNKDLQSLNLSRSIDNRYQIPSQGAIYGNYEICHMEMALLSSVTC